MRGFIDLHCHWLPEVDDGAQSLAESLAMLAALRQSGFDEVWATPHMHAVMFDNSRAELEAAYQRVLPAVEQAANMPRTGLGCEHHLDDIVFDRLMSGQGLPFGEAGAVLIELPFDRIPVLLDQRLFELRCQKLRPLLAHPERQRPAWQDIAVLEPIVDGGTLLVLDVAALTGAQGRATRRTAERLLEEGFYYAACSDAHSVRDAVAVASAIDKLFDVVGTEEAEFLLIEGPRSILEGRVED